MTKTRTPGVQQSSSPTPEARGLGSQGENPSRNVAEGRVSPQRVRLTSTLPDTLNDPAAAASTSVRRFASWDCGMRGASNRAHCTARGGEREWLSEQGRANARCVRPPARGTSSRTPIFDPFNNPSTRVFFVTTSREFENTGRWGRRRGRRDSKSGFCLRCRCPVGETGLHHVWKRKRMSSSSSLLSEACLASTVPSNTSCFFFCKSNILASMVPLVTKRVACTAFVWPMR